MNYWYNNVIYQLNTHFGDGNRLWFHWKQYANQIKRINNTYMCTIILLMSNVVKAILSISIDWNVDCKMWRQKFEK